MLKAAHTGSTGSAVSMHTFQSRRLKADKPCTSSAIKISVSTIISNLVDRGMLT